MKFSAGNEKWTLFDDRYLGFGMEGAGQLFSSHFYLPPETAKIHVQPHTGYTKEHKTPCSSHREQRK